MEESDLDRVRIKPIDYLYVLFFAVISIAYSFKKLNFGFGPQDKQPKIFFHI